MSELPTGTVTFLFTDVEQSSALWERHPDRMGAALACHDALAAEAIAASRGVLVKSRGEGDSLFAVFPNAPDAVCAACRLQQALAAQSWPHGEPMRVRIALHTGGAELLDGDYRGIEVNRAARIRSLAYGGQILLSQPVVDLSAHALPSDCGLRDLGEHRLKDLRHPERLWQLCHPTLPAEFPPLRSLNTLPNNLPQQLSSFIGRETEIAEACRRLTANRLLTFTGPGGVGKTRLSLQVAAEMIENFTDGVCFVELAPLTDPALVPQTIAALLDCDLTGAASPTATLTAFLATRSLLLVLDNCEHLIQACADLAYALLRVCPRLHILATSREALDIGGEAIWPVPTFSAPDPKHLPPLETLAQNPAIRLFVERAQAVAPTFALNAETAPHVAAICARVDGLAFAIELAAAKIRLFTVGEIEKRLFRLLKNEARNVAARHRAIETLIDWSYQLLQPEEARALCQLSVFAGGWTLEAAESVCADAESADDVFGLLSHLVRASLVMRQECGDSSRYRMLETVREFGRQKLAADDTADVTRHRHAAYYLGLAEQAEPYLNGREQARWLTTLETEHDNLRAALTASAAPAGLRLQLASLLWRFWAQRGHLAEGCARLQQTLAAGKNAPPAIRARALQGLGTLTSRQNDPGKARACLEESLRIRRELGEARDIAVSLNSLGNIARQQADLARAQECYAESRALFAELGDRAGLAGALGNLGMIAYGEEDYAQAEECYEQSLAIYRQMDNADGIARMLSNLALVSRQQGKMGETRQRYEASLALYRELGNQWAISILLHNMSDLASKERDFDTAFGLMRESLVISLELQDSASITEAMGNLAMIAVRQGQPARAARLLAVVEKRREVYGQPLLPQDGQEYDECAAAARSTLTPEVWSAAWTIGRALPEAESITYALCGEA